MHPDAKAIYDRVDEMSSRLRAVPEIEAAHKPGPERWSKKEILGHLIDSAGNNHQRFVRAQLETALNFPNYEQEHWVRCQQYAAADWSMLVDLWVAYNRHLAWIVDHISSERLGTPCQIGEREPVALAWLIEDYIKHMDHHLSQLMRSSAIL